MSKENKCENCRYYYPVGELGMGECKKYAPKVYPAGEKIRIINEAGMAIREEKEIYTRTCFPRIHKSEFCGEFKEKLSNH